MWKKKEEEKQTWPPSSLLLRSRRNFFIFFFFSRAWTTITRPPPPSQISLQRAHGWRHRRRDGCAGHRGLDPPPVRPTVARAFAAAPTTTLRPRPSVGPSVTFWVVVSTEVFFFFFPKTHFFFHPISFSSTFSYVRARPASYTHVGTAAVSRVVVREIAIARPAAAAAPRHSATVDNPQTGPALQFPAAIVLRPRRVS